VDLTSDDVRDILQLLDGLPYQELQLETARFRLSLRRTGGASGEGGGWTQSTEILTVPHVLPMSADTADSLLARTAVAETAAAAPRHPGEPPPAESGLADVRAPLLGTFYRAPRPGAPPFVEVGSTVEPDTVVCIIETMKLMNSVTAGAAGTVAQILVENAQFADQGAVLMRIQPE
jgi:acetyl-CoA carboxylase biotin carboxyl carrier protein